MTDIVERLRDHKPSVGFGGCQDCDGMRLDEAADEIERLVAELAACRDDLVQCGTARDNFASEITRLRSELERLTTALIPFFSTNPALEDAVWGDQPDSALMTIRVKFGLYKSAREAMAAARSSAFSSTEREHD